MYYGFSNALHKKVVHNPIFQHWKYICIRTKVRYEKVFFSRPKLVLWFDRYFRHNQNKERNIKNYVGFGGWFLAHVSKTFLNLLTPKLKTGIRLYTVFPHMRSAVTENKDWVIFECGYNSREGLIWEIRHLTQSKGQGYDLTSAALPTHVIW